MSNFVSKLISGNKHRICYLRAIDFTGLAAWYFMLLHPAKREAFSKIDPKQGYNIEDYGNILKSGYGEYAPSSVITDINQKYDCDFT